MLKCFCFAFLSLFILCIVSTELRAENKIIQGKTVNNRTVASGSRLILRSGGKTLNSRIMQGGVESVLPGGISRNAAICKGGVLKLAGGKSYYAVIEDGGLMKVQASYAANTKILSGGSKRTCRSVCRSALESLCRIFESAKRSRPVCQNKIHHGLEHHRAARLRDHGSEPDHTTRFRSGK